MFVAHEVTVEAPYDIALARLLRLTNRGSFRRLSETSYDAGIEDVLRVGPLGDRPGLSKLVRIQTLEPVTHGDATTVALRWEATGAAGELFPVLDADIVLAADGRDRCRLKLSGSYRAPLGQIGATLDRIVMNRIATATIRSFLDAVAATLSDPSASEAAEQPVRAS